jgi:hypothetical protein
LVADLSERSLCFALLEEEARKGVDCDIANRRFPGRDLTPNAI